MLSLRSGKAEAPILVSDITRSRPSTQQHLPCSSVLDFPNSPRTTILPSILRDTTVASPTLLSLVCQWPIAISVARNLSVGDLINLARTSSSLRAALHGFPIPPVYDADLGTDKEPQGKPEKSRNGVRPTLQIGEHCTPYWEGLKRAAQFVCSSKTHTKGEKTRSCLYCSMPICESCVIKHSFGKNENTFKNRCRFMCQRCWDTGNQQKAHRFTGKSDEAETCHHKFSSEARSLCICTSKDGWLCNDCKEKQNTSMRVDGSDVCFGQYCETKLVDDRDRRKICLWCDKPAPRGRPNMKYSQAFDDKLMVDAKEFMWYINEWGSYSQGADIEHQNKMRSSGPMLMSRRDLRGNHAVKDDPDADVEQYLLNPDKINYQHFCLAQPSQDEISGSRHCEWKYNSDFLRCFMKICTKHSDAAFLRTATYIDPNEAPCSKTNMDLWRDRVSRTLDEPAKVDGFAESLEADFHACLNSPPDKTGDHDWDEEQTLADDRTLTDVRTLAGNQTLADNGTLADDRTLADNRTLGEEALIEEPRLADDRAPAGERKLAGKRTLDDGVGHPLIKESDVRKQPQDLDDGLAMQQDDAAPDAGHETEAQAHHNEQSFESGLHAMQLEERPPEYGADTLVLETGDALRST